MSINYGRGAKIVRETSLSETKPPLSKHAVGVLRSLLLGPEPRQTLNAGVARRLEQDALIETYSAKTPYVTRKGDILWVRLTEAGEQLARARA